jgi:hypothetical protein
MLTGQPIGTVEGTLLADFRLPRCSITFCRSEIP